MKYTMMQEKILNTAESLIQKLGYNAFSYKDIANAVGIKTSSIHYYYPTKEDLAVAVIDWQLERLSLFLRDIQTDSKRSLQQKLNSLVGLISSITLHDDMKMCLGGMLASDVLSLPEKLGNKVRLFFNHLEEWILELIQTHQEANDKAKFFSNRELARLLLVQIEGALLLSRLYNDVNYVENVNNFIQKFF